jgi:hypothetical protein
MIYFFIIYVIGVIISPILIKYSIEKDCEEFEKESFLEFYSPPILEWLPYVLFISIVWPIGIPILLFID